MASPTEAELEAILAAAYHLPYELLRLQTLQVQLDALTAIIEADNAAEILAGAKIGVSAIDDAFADFEDVLLESWRAYNLHQVGGDADTAEAIFAEVYEYLIDNSGSIESRVFSNGSVSAGGSNVGDGTVRRVLVDPEGHAIQNRHAQVVTFRCRQDVNLGTLRNGARFSVKGTGRDRLGRFLPYKSASTKGGGGEQFMSSHHASTAGNLILNGSFDEVQVAAGQPTTGNDAALASGDTISNWTVATGAITDFTSSVDSVYREEPGVSVSKLLIFEDNAKLTQNWDALGISAVVGTCYWPQIALQRKSSCDGAFNARLGALTFTIADITATLTNNVWTLLVPTANENLYGQNLTESGATNEVELSGRTTGLLWVDSFQATPMPTFVKIPHAPVSGATDTLKKDTYSFTDTLSAEGKIALLIFLFFGAHLPHNATPTIPDP